VPEQVAKLLRDLGVALDAHAAAAQCAFGARAREGEERDRRS